MTDRTERIHRRPVSVANPAAGAELVIQPFLVGAWRILNLQFTFTASAVVANRNIALSLSDGTTRTWRATTAIVQAAASAQDYEAYPFAVAGASVSGLALIALPPDGLWLPKGFTLRTTTALIDVADQYSQITMDVQEIPDGPEWMAEPSMTLNTVPLDQ